MHSGWFMTKIELPLCLRSKMLFSTCTICFPAKRGTGKAVGNCCDNEWNNSAFSDRQWWMDCHHDHDSCMLAATNVSKIAQTIVAWAGASPVSERRDSWAQLALTSLGHSAHARNIHCLRQVRVLRSSTHITFDEIFEIFSFYFKQDQALRNVGNLCWKYLQYLIFCFTLKCILLWTRDQDQWVSVPCAHMLEWPQHLTAPPAAGCCAYPTLT